MLELVTEVKFLSIASNFSQWPVNLLDFAGQNFQDNFFPEKLKIGGFDRMENRKARCYY